MRVKLQFIAIIVVVVVIGGYYLGDSDSTKQAPVSLSIATGSGHSNRIRESSLFKAPSASEIQQSREMKLKRAQVDSDRFFNRERFVHDQDYARKCRKYLAIGRYQNSSRRGDPNYEKVLHTLLQNGYGIEQWEDACNRLMQLHQPLLSRRVSLEQRGYSEEEIQESLREVRNSLRPLERRVAGLIVQKIGIMEPEAIASLMSIPIVVGNNENPFGLGNRRFSEGDRILTDDDWMTPEHRASLASYQGEPRPQLTSSEKFRMFREWQASQRVSEAVKGSSGALSTE